MHPAPYNSVHHEMNAPLPYSYTWAYLTREIQPGRLGRLRYLGTEWNACAVENIQIAKGTPVVPLQRQGNTWLVRPVTPGKICYQEGNYSGFADGMLSQRCEG